MTLQELYLIIKDRKDKKPEGSYIASLFAYGLDRIAQKVGEEGVEVVIAAKNENKERFVEEVADLWFHSLVLLNEKNVGVEEILAELQKRHESKK